MSLTFRIEKYERSIWSRHSISCNGKKSELESGKNTKNYGREKLGVETIGAPGKRRIFGDIERKEV